MHSEVFATCICRLIDLYRDAGRRAGHPAGKLIVGLHSIGFLGDTTQQAADDFYPGYAHTFTEIGKERGWPQTTRAQFDAVRGPTGALLIGDAETVAEKILYVNEVLGGLSRITFQMGVSTLPHQKMLQAIEILGTRVAPAVRKELTASHARPDTRPCSQTRLPALLNGAPCQLKTW